MKGIDVSYANGAINWKEVSKEIDFAVLRSSFGSDLPGQTDNRYDDNAKGCIANKLPFGTYHFAYFVDEKTAREEAAFAVRLANCYEQHSGMIALDVEEDSQRYASSLGRHPDWTKCALAFLEYVEAAGYTAVLYTNYDWMTNKYDYNQLKKYPLWLASPGASEDVPKRYGNIVLWQNSWDGRFSGIDGAVDTDICYNGAIFGKQSTGSGAKPSQNTQQQQPSQSAGRHQKPQKPQQEISQITSSQGVNYDVRITAEDGVNLRSGAGTSYQVLGAVPKGERVHISRQTSGGDYSWGLTEYRKIRGWIALNYTQKLPRKTAEQLAQEVIRGEWGSGEERERLLTRAGYDYDAVQRIVNKLMQS